MCRASKCGVCGKTTWAGCGQHIDAVRSSVPASQWCEGHSAAEKVSEKAAAPRKVWLSRLFG